MSTGLAPRDRYVTVNGIRLRYRDWGGGGPPLLALHGSAAHAHWWDPVAPFLARDYRLLALDWRGHGDSDDPDSDFGYSLVGLKLAARLGTEPPTVRKQEGEGPSFLTPGGSVSVSARA